MPTHPLLSTLLHAFPRDGRPQQLLEIHIWEYKTGQLAKRFGRQRVRPVLHPRPLSSGPESGLVNQLFALVGYALCAHLFDATLVLPDFESHDHHGTQLPFATLFEVEPLIEALRAANVSAITRDAYGHLRVASNAARGRNRRAANATVASSTGTSTGTSTGLGTTVVRCGWSCRNMTGGAGAAMVVNVLQGDALLGWRAYKALQRILFLRTNVSAPEAARLRNLEASVYRGLQVARAVRESVRQAERTLLLRPSTRVGGQVSASSLASSSNRGGGSSNGRSNSSGSGGAGRRDFSRGAQDDGPDDAQDDAPATDEASTNPELHDHVSEELPAYGCMHARIEADMIKSQAFNYAGRPPRLDDYLPPLAPVALRATPMVFVAVGTDISAVDDARLLRRAPWGAVLVRTGREAKSRAQGTGDPQRDSSSSYTRDALIDLELCRRARWFAGWPGSTFARLLGAFQFLDHQRGWWRVCPRAGVRGAAHSAARPAGNSTGDHDAGSHAISFFRPSVATFMGQHDWCIAAQRSRQGVHSTTNMDVSQPASTPEVLNLPHVDAPT